MFRWADPQNPLGGDKVDRNDIDLWVQKVDAWDGNLFAAAFGGAAGVLKLTTEYKINVAEAQAKKNPGLAEVYQKKIKAMKVTITEPMDKAKVEASKTQLVSLLDEAEGRLANSPFLAGEEYSVADEIFTPCLYRIPQVKLDKTLIEPRTNVEKYGAAEKETWLQKVFWSLRKSFVSSGHGDSSHGKDTCLQAHDVLKYIDVCLLFCMKLYLEF